MYVCSRHLSRNFESMLFVYLSPTLRRKLLSLCTAAFVCFSWARVTRNFALFIYHFDIYYARGFVVIEYSTSLNVLLRKFALHEELYIQIIYV